MARGQLHSVQGCWGYLQRAPHPSALCWFTSKEGGSERAGKRASSTPVPLFPAQREPTHCSLPPHTCFSPPCRHFESHYEVDEDETISKFLNAVREGGREKQGVEVEGQGGQGKEWQGAGWDTW